MSNAIKPPVTGKRRKEEKSVKENELRGETCCLFQKSEIINRTQQLRIDFSF
ncbi:hypothetical protein HK107_02370 [Parvularcula sp. ZS-1/3]|uniref:Uncharacterized protein n=1 Tax=Parvularcula mediterranea TaxID=2732508 RepID=A0A7Y3RJE6_9PROT|nr:hypothetical protein [Parvularcula mediterranea]NNU15169.1 hypothetical protein [Parvularcula mediterranea]